MLGRGQRRDLGAAGRRQLVSLGAFDPASQPGVQAPLGYWDPAGLQDGTEETFLRYRTAEIKHGRVAMMAIAGLLYQHSNALPGFPTVSGLKALQEPLAQQGMAFVFLLTGFYELLIFRDGRPGQAFPGDFGNPLGWVQGDDDASPTYLPRAQNGELANGRLAMIGFIGVTVAEANTGLDAVDQWAAATQRWGSMTGFENF